MENVFLGISCIINLCEDEGAEDNANWLNEISQILDINFISTKNMKCEFGKSYKLFYFQVGEPPAPPQHADSHPCTRPPSWGTQWARCVGILVRPCVWSWTTFAKTKHVPIGNDADQNICCLASTECNLRVETYLDREVFRLVKVIRKFLLRRC